MLRKTGDKIEPIGQLVPRLSHTLPRVSPTGKHVALAIYRQEQMVVLETATGKELMFLDKGFNHYADFVWLSDNQLLGLATGKARRGLKESEQKLVLWDVTTKEILKSVTSSAVLDVIALAPDGRTFAAAGPDKRVHFYNTDTLAEMREFRAHEGTITVLDWHPTRRILATGSEDLTLRLWDMNTGQRIAELRGPLATPHTLAFSPSGSRLGCASLDGTTRLWEMNFKQDDGVSISPVVKREKPPPPTAPITAPATAGPAPAVSIPAKGKWELLLASLVAEKVEKDTNGWRLEKGSLHTHNGPPTVLPLIPIAEGESYEVKVRLTRKGLRHVFVVGLPVGDRMVGFELDGLNGDEHYTGLNHVDGKRGSRLPGSLKGVQIADESAHDLLIRVQPSGPTATITATLDGKAIYSWSGPIASLDIEKHWSPGPGMMGIGALSDEWTVSELRVRKG